MSATAWCFFLLPFSLYGGIAAQATGLYAVGIVLPWLFLRLGQAPSSVALRSCLQVVSLVLISMWLLFPVANIINAGLVASVLPEPLPFQRLMTSKLPSTWLASGVLAWLISMDLSRRARQKPQPVHRAADDHDLLRAFCYGSLAAAFCFGAYFVAQHLTGYDYRLPGPLPPNRLLGGSSFYRISGCFGHPLSMAAVALAQSGFFLLLFFFSFRQAHEPSYRATNTEPLPWLWRRGARQVLMTNALLNLAFLVMTGGRAAIGLGMLAWGGGACFFLSQIYNRKIVGLGVTLATAVFGAMVYSTGLGARVYELLVALQEGSVLGAERLVFWRVHWQIFLDYPLLGRGAAHLSHGVRNLYYANAGLAGFHQKYNAHNIYLELLTNIGILGCLAAGLALAWLARRLWQTCANNPCQQALYLASLFSLGLNAVNGLSQNTFFDGSLVAVYLAWMWLLLWQLADHQRPDPSKL